MKERPILFSGPLVRAILEGRKTQTRRVVKCRGRWACECPDSDEPWPYFENELGEWEFFECPHGTVGDRLWVRECFGTTAAVPTSTAKDEFAFLWQPELFAYRADNPSGRWCWRPSIHMPRWASRITLEITGVRVERLQEISEKDAQAEGCERLELGPQQIGGIPVHPMTTSYVEAFQQLWSSINGPESWSANPWVWVIEFRRVVHG